MSRPLRDPWAALEGVTFNPPPKPVEAAPAPRLGLWRRLWARIRAAFAPHPLRDAQ